MGNDYALMLFVGDEKRRETLQAAIECDQWAIYHTTDRALADGIQAVYAPEVVMLDDSIGDLQPLFQRFWGLDNVPIVVFTNKPERYPGAYIVPRRSPPQYVLSLLDALVSRSVC